MGTRTSRAAPREGRPTVIDLYSGCAGGSIGFRQAAFCIVGAVEIDVDAAASYRLNVGAAVRPMEADSAAVAQATPAAG